MTQPINNTVVKLAKIFCVAPGKIKGGECGVVYPEIDVVEDLCE